MAEGTNRNHGEHESQLDRFRAYTVAHPRLVKAKDALMNAITGRGTKFPDFCVWAGRGRQNNSPAENRATDHNGASERNFRKTA